MTTSEFYMLASVYKNNPAPNLHFVTNEENLNSTNAGKSI